LAVRGLWRGEGADGKSEGRSRINGSGF
jgi:hypothetical protein